MNFKMLPIEKTDCFILYINEPKGGWEGECHLFYGVTG